GFPRGGWPPPSPPPPPADRGGGRGGPPLDVAQCRAAWKTASPNGQPIPGAAAKPYVFDFEAMDVDQDGKISEYEFKDGCIGGWVREAPDATAKDDQVRSNSASLRCLAAEIAHG